MSIQTSSLNIRSTSNNLQVVTLTGQDFKDLGRRLFSDEVQGSRLDLAAYDTDSSRQAFWAGEAEKWAVAHIRTRQGAGEDVVLLRVIDGVTTRIA